jgi:hypothetical protein
MAQSSLRGHQHSRSSIFKDNNATAATFITISTHTSHNHHSQVENKPTKKAQRPLLAHLGDEIGRVAEAQVEMRQGLHQKHEKKEPAPQYYKQLLRRVAIVFKLELLAESSPHCPLTSSRYYVCRRNFLTKPRDKAWTADF